MSMASSAGRAASVASSDAVITIGRWNVTITGLTPTGAFVTYIASADSYLTQNDGIWFGTQSEYMEETAL
jgi:hypothetical protein